MIEYQKISLFDAPKGSVLVHACNSQGVWGSGIAKEFKNKFPEAFKQYNKYCTFEGIFSNFDRRGTALITNEENDYKVGCLITSSSYGQNVDSIDLILKNTEKALEDLVKPGMSSIFYSNKFNSGLFKVPWEKTETLLKQFTEKYNIDWVICDPNLS